MKNSGVEWIGEIPDEWEVKKVKYIFSERKNKNIGTKEKNLLSLSYGKIVRKNITNMEGLIPESYETYNILQPGDIVFRLTDLQNDKHSLRTGLCKEKGIITSAYTTVIPPKTVDPVYIHYLFHAYDNCKVFYNLGDGVRQGMKYSDLCKLNIILPPKSTQQRIASYLDKKCSKIEETIQNQQQVIEKLKAYKQSLITEAATGKIKIQNVKVCGKYESYKDSGVEWIGKIPSEWEVGKFGRFAQVKSNLVDPNLYLEYPQIAPDNIGKGSGKLIDWQTVKDSGVISWNHLFFKGQIVYSKIRPTLNKLIIAPFDGLCSADMYPIETNMYKQFFVYMMLSQYFVEQVGLITRDRVKMPKINQNELSGILITIPTKNEQKEISDYLDKKCTAIDTAIEQKQKLIEKLTEYKKSLIYECVTGKKEI